MTGIKRNSKRPTLRDTQIANQAAMDQYARLMGRPTVDLGPIKAAPKPRAFKLKPDEPLEKDIQKAILTMLSVHKDVCFAGRFNSGAAQSEYNGVKSFVRFNTLPGFPDIHGMLKGGRALYIEVKRRGGLVSADQKVFLELAKAGGAAAGVAYSVEDALGILSGNN